MYYQRNVLFFFHEKDVLELFLYIFMKHQNNPKIFHQPLFQITEYFPRWTISSWKIFEIHINAFFMIIVRRKFFVITVLQSQIAEYASKMLLNLCKIRLNDYISRLVCSKNVEIPFDIATPLPRIVSTLIPGGPAHRSSPSVCLKTRTTSKCVRLMRRCLCRACRVPKTIAHIPLRCCCCARPERAPAAAAAFSA